MSDLEAGNLSNLQLELLKLYADDVPEEDLRQIKQLIASYFAQKAIEEADNIWDKNQWSEQDAVNMAAQHYRTRYKPE